MQISLGRAAEQRGAFDEAMAAYKDALTRDKRRADAYQRIAILHDRKGEFRQSAEMYQKALSLAPGNAEIYCDMGYSLFLQRRWAESERNLRQAIAAKPDFARAYNNLGLLLAQNHRDEEALAAYRKANQNEAEARGNLAAALALAGRLPDARDQYQRVLENDPKSKVAQTRLKEVDRLLARNIPPGMKGTTDRQISRVSAARAPATTTLAPPGGSGVRDEGTTRGQ